MTVKELVQLLRKYPNDLRVVVNGYEDGFDDLSPERISVIKVQLDTQIHDWEGQHSDFHGSETEISNDAENCRGSGFSSSMKEKPKEVGSGGMPSDTESGTC